MSSAETSRFVRLNVELVLEIEDSDAVVGSALQRIAEDDAALRLRYAQPQPQPRSGAAPEGAAPEAESGAGSRATVRPGTVAETTAGRDGAGAGARQGMMDEDRARAEAAVQEDDTEALVYLVDPFDLVGAVPGVGLVQASWSCEEIDYDADSPERGPGGDDDAGEADGAAR